MPRKPPRRNDDSDAVDFTSRAKPGASTRTFTVADHPTIEAVEDAARRAIAEAAAHGLTSFGAQFTALMDYPDYKPALGTPPDWPRIYSFRITSRKARRDEIKASQEEAED